MMLPILQQEVVLAVSGGKLKVELEGKFPKNWEKIFHQFCGERGFVTSKVQGDEVGVVDVDPLLLFDYFEDLMGFWDDPDDDSLYF